MDDRHTEHRHNRVTDELLHRPPVRLDDPAHPVEIAGKRRPHRLRVARLTERRRAHDIAEHERHGLPLLPRPNAGHRSAAARTEAGDLRVLGTARNASRHPASLPDPQVDGQPDNNVPSPHPMGRGHPGRLSRGGAALAALALVGLAATESAMPARTDTVTITMLATTTAEPAYAILIPNFERVYPNISVQVTYVLSSSLPSLELERAGRRERPGHPLDHPRPELDDLRLPAGAGGRPRPDAEQALDEAVAPAGDVALEVRSGPLHLRAVAPAVRGFHERRALQEARPDRPADVLPAPHALPEGEGRRDGRARDGRRQRDRSHVPAGQPRRRDRLRRGRALGRETEGGHGDLRRDGGLAPGAPGVRRHVECRVLPARHDRRHAAHRGWAIRPGTGPDGGGDLEPLRNDRCRRSAVLLLLLSRSRAGRPRHRRERRSSSRTASQ